MRTRRAWIALVATPFVLGAAVLPVVAWLAVTRGVRGDALFAAMEPLAAIPVSLGFAMTLLLTRRLARADGLTLADLGWRRPSLADVAVGVLVGVAVWAVNRVALYPMIQALRPGFDPTLGAMRLPAALTMIAIAVAAEDTLYRGFALTVLRRRHGTVLAVLVTSACNALIAPGQGWPLVLWAFLFGVLLCGVRLWRNNLWPVVIVHGLVGLGPRLLTYAS